MFINLARLIRNFAALGELPTRRNQRVRLVDTKRKASSENPIMGTRYECEGTVIHTDTDYGPKDIRISVKWDNKHRNIYHFKDLVVSDLPCNPHPYHFKANFTKSNPNYTFKERKAALRYYEESRPHNYINELISKKKRVTWL